MINKKGSILSPINSLANKLADKNYIIVRNIYKYPIKEKFKAYLVDIYKKKIHSEIDLLTNTTNFIKLKNHLIRPEIYLFTKSYLGVPIYLSEKNGHLSLEHTHPPHEYILNKNKYELISKIKSNVNEIINK